MCGIAGFTGRANPLALHRMTSALSHRGPDADGFYSDAATGVHFGHRRLSILDHEGGAQPMHSWCGNFVIVFNGEIYNFRELREELAGLGATFRTDHSDTEVLLEGWRYWGTSMPARLNGMWAFVIHDQIKGTLFASRDRFGKKPFFWCHTGNAFIFASELTSIRIHPSTPSSLDDIAIQKYFAYGYVPAPRTFIQGVHKLPAGHSLELNLAGNKLSIKRYWKYTPQIDPALNERDAEEHLYQLLGKAVSRRMVADVPIGCFLSGGLDSSIITALAKEQCVNSRIKAYSIGFDEDTFDESRFASQVAQHLGLEHKIRSVSLKDTLINLPNLLENWDEPIADSSIVPTWLLCAHARSEVTVALGGDGADELFAGYDPFKALRYARLAERLLPRPIHRGIALLAAKLPVSHRYMSFDFQLKRLTRGMAYPPSLRLPVWMSPTSQSELAELFNTPIELEELYSEAIDLWEDASASNDIDRTIAFYINLYLTDNIMVKLDRSSMLHSLEVRSPFLDLEVVEYAQRLPTHLKLRNNTTKYLLRKIGARLLPETILTRKKQGFALPVGQWFADGSLGGPDDFTLHSAFWKKKLNEHRKHSQDNRLYLWAETVLQKSRIYKQSEHASPAANTGAITT